jgi:hypothetical protein
MDMVLTEEEKKEYLINYRPQTKWRVKFTLLSAVVFSTWLFIFVLSDLGYINLDFNDKVTTLFACILGFVSGNIVNAIRKAKK